VAQPSPAARATPSDLSYCADSVKRNRSSPLQRADVISHNVAEVCGLRTDGLKSASVRFTDQSSRAGINCGTFQQHHDARAAECGALIKYGIRHQVKKTTRPTARGSVLNDTARARPLCDS